MKSEPKGERFNEFRRGGGDLTGWENDEKSKRGRKLLRRQATEIGLHRRKSEPKGERFNEYSKGADLTGWENDEKSNEGRKTVQVAGGLASKTKRPQADGIQNQGRLCSS
ncbi:hypothetical protein J27TS7_37670 [Paenibacillus dendritiformis]|nr:hypothetical protein J27TS7_37670 [Paenibacillus dendritiformis]